MSGKSGIGVSFALNNQPGMRVVAEAEDGIEAVEKFLHHWPDVIILNLHMPRRNGIETSSIFAENAASCVS